MDRFWDRLKPKKRSSSRSSSKTSARPGSEQESVVAATSSQPPPNNQILPSTNLRITQDGLSKVYEHAEAEVDIVFLHGLNGDPRKTWTSDKTSVFWPSDLLPQTLEEQQLKVRVMTYGYNSRIGGSGDDSPSSEFLYEHARTFVTRLISQRQKTASSKRPIIFVAHSLGGLVLKQALLYAHTALEPDEQNLKTQKLKENRRSIYISTFGLVFLGTPHSGSELGNLGAMIVGICSLVFPSRAFDLSSPLVKTLISESETLSSLKAQFVDLHSRYSMFFFYETQQTVFPHKRQMIVERQSAVPVIEGTESMGIRADHSHMCKYPDKFAYGYEDVSDVISRYVSEAPLEIQERWKREGRMPVLRAHELEDQARASANPSSVIAANSPRLAGTDDNSPVTSTGTRSPLTSSGIVRRQEPPFIVPHWLRTSLSFFGMKNELSQLSKALIHERRLYETSAVVITGAPGSGKTHLARQFILNQRADFPGGIFWVDAKSYSTRKSGFGIIAEELMRQNSILSASGVIGSPGSDIAEEVRVAREANLKLDEVDVMRRWFDSHEGWLIVFDSIRFESDRDGETFGKFLPFSRKDTSIIYTTVDRALITTNAIASPSLVDTKPLDVESARKLAFKILNIRSPKSEEIEKVDTLIKSYESLPLAIEAEMHYIVATGQRLKNYRPDSYSTRTELADTFKRIGNALDDNKHPAERRLINLLSFFHQDVPVGMIYFGITVFFHEEEIESLDSGLRHGLDQMIGVLLKYGVVQRTSTPAGIRSVSNLRHSSTDSASKQTTNSADDAPQLSDSQVHDSQSSSNSSLILIDIVRMHSVVQSSFLNELNRDQAAFDHWLVQAIKVFHAAFEEVERRISGSDEQGYVRDYRECDIQCDRLLSHFKRPHIRNKSTPALEAARKLLHRIMERIRSQIERLGPNSSQINFRACVSIFSRVSSSSEGPSTPKFDSSGTEGGSDSVPLRYMTWGFDHDDIPSESPDRETFASSVPFKALPDHMLLPPEPPTEYGYESDREDVGIPTAIGSRRTSSRGTTGSSAGSDGTAMGRSSTQAGGKLTKRRSTLGIFHRPPRASGKYSNLGDFRPVVPNATAPSTQIEHTSGSFALKGDVSASEFLQQHQLSNSGDRCEDSTSLMARGLARADIPSSSRTEPTNGSRVEDGSLIMPFAHVSPTISHATSPMLRNLSEGSAVTALREYTTVPALPHHIRNGSDPITHAAQSYIADRLTHTQPGRHSSPFLLGPNTEPLPYETVMVSRGPRVVRSTEEINPAAVGGPHGQAVTLQYHQRSSTSETSSPPIPTVPNGYTSLPMSRDSSALSAQSQISLQSELPRQFERPFASSFVSGFIPPPGQPSKASSPRASPRLRSAGIDRPIMFANSPALQMARDPSHGSSGSVLSEPMSRSGSGPGMLIQSPNPNQPPSFVQFGNYAERPFVPTSIDDDNERSSMRGNLNPVEYQRRRQPFEEGVYRRERRYQQRLQQQRRRELNYGLEHGHDAEYRHDAANLQRHSLVHEEVRPRTTRPSRIPYPDINLIPTASDAADLRQLLSTEDIFSSGHEEMADADNETGEEEASRGRKRGLSSYNIPVIGLPSTARGEEER